MSYESMDGFVCSKCLHTIFKDECLCTDLEKTAEAQEVAMGRTGKPTREYLEKVFADGERLRAQQRANAAFRANQSLLLNAVFGSHK